MAEFWTLGHMDIPDKMIPWFLIGIATLVGLLVVALMRYFVRVSGHEQVFKDGLVMRESGIEYFGFFFTGTRRVPYSQIASVDLIPHYKYVLSRIVLIYGFSTQFICRRGFGKIVVIRFKQPNPIEYLFFTPSNAARFYEQLKSRIGH